MTTKITFYVKKWSRNSQSLWCGVIKEIVHEVDKNASVILENQKNTIILSVTSNMYKEEVFKDKISELWLEMDINFHEGESIPQPAVKYDERDECGNPLAYYLPLSMLNLPARVQNTLIAVVDDWAHKQPLYLGDMACHTEKEYLRTRQCGKKTLAYIKACFLYFKVDFEERRAEWRPTNVEKISIQNFPGEHVVSKKYGDWKKGIQEIYEKLLRDL